MNRYDVGDMAHITAIFADPAGEPLDPAVVKFHFRTPAGAKITYTYLTDAQIVKSGVGNYYVDLPLSAAGDWLYRWESTGSGAAGGSGVLIVEATPL